MPANSDYHDIYEICHAGWNDFLIEAQTNMEYYLGAQWASDEYEMAERQRRRLYVMNKIKRQVNLIHGYEIRNRHVLKIGPIGKEDDHACQLHTGLVMQQMTREDFSGYDQLSEAFKWGSLISGSNLVELWKDREGLLHLTRHGFNSFLLNPSFQRPDLSDCEDILTGRWISGEKIKMLVPTGADRIDKIPPLNASARWDLLGQPLLNNNGRFRLYEEWWHKEIKYVETVLNRVSGQEITWKEFQSLNGEDSRRLLNEVRLNDGMPVLTKYSKPVARMRLTIHVDDNEIWSGTNPTKLDEHNFVWLHGDFAPEMENSALKLQSFVYALRDPQRARNRRICQALDIIESQIQTGRMVRDKYLKIPEDAYRSGQGIPIHINDDAPDEIPLAEIFKQIEGVDIKPGLFQIMELLDRDETEIGSMNEEIMGSDDKDVPGVLARYRTGQALTAQQGIFAGFRGSKRQLGRKMVRMNQLNLSPQRVFRMVNEYPTPEFYEPDLVKYDCIPTEGLLTDSQQHMFYLELKGLRAMFPDMAEIITPSMLISVMPIQFKRELMKAVQMSEQQRQQMAQAQMADQQRMNRLIEAETAENIANAQEDRSDTALTRVKTMAEIQKLQREPFYEMIDKVIELEKIRGQKNASQQKG